MTSLYTIMGLLTLITLTAFEFCKIDRISVLAMIPYIACVTLLFRLNFSIFRNY
ncbi:tryptophan-rich sensory protein [[Brevibacterium] frigoritolerans]|uniref:Tryptophan-rich sensory protein n=1 Tax=Peribacillus frigoritolerans TaxID=450367 RepID=A0A941J3N7_9BACI|nr:tryptophan-rich sensory protein [Peribacillus frigoritolerans]